MNDDDKTVGAGRRRRPVSGSDDAHSTARANRNADEHSTARANRNADEHSTARANRNSQEHSTTRASRNGGEPDAELPKQGNKDNGQSELRPYEQQEGNAFKNEINKDTKATGPTGWPDFFILDGVKYRNEGILSDSSGEALVFTVTRNGRKFALKLYYYDPDHRPDHKLLEKIKQLGGSGLLVSIISHGVWDNPARPGESNDYELMEFCEGGTLDGIVLKDEKALAMVAVRMASAIDFLAKHGILHRDIKPSNFFYADKEKTRIVLADFGISAECPEGELVKIDEMRSPVYASPEFYTNVPGEPAEVGIESDFFSLGVSLLCLWLGKDKLTADEGVLLRAKLNENLPIPDDMSPHMASLIKALTRLKMSERATFDDIKRWAEGENLDGADAEASDFRIVFNSAKNQVAHSPEELADLMLADKTLAKQYLYSGRITEWLEQNECNELGVYSEVIYKNRYPKNQEAGLMSTIYLLNPAADYIAPDGERFSSPGEAARYVFINHSEIGDEVMRDDSNLMIWLRSRKADKAVEAVREYARSGEVRNGRFPAFKTTFYLNVLLNESAPLPVSVKDDDWEFVDTIEELIGVLHDEGTIDVVNQTLIESPAFIVWLAYRKPELAGLVRMLHDKSNDDKESIYYHSGRAYRIIYEIYPECDLFFNADTADPDRVYTIREIGRYLNNRLIAFSEGKEHWHEFDNLFDRMYKTQDLAQYLRARGESYAKFLGWTRYCMSTSGDNEKKAGPHDAVIGAYKAVAGFLQGDPLEYKLGDVVLTDPSQLKQLPRKQVAEALDGKARHIPTGNGRPVPWLDAWLAVFFQENPRLDLSKKFTYERETVRYIDFIGELDPSNYYYERYHRAIRSIDKAAGKISSSDRWLKIKRIIFLIIGLAPTLAMLLGGWLLGAPEGNPIKGHFLITWGICAVGLFMIMFFTGLSLIGPIVGGLILAFLIYLGFALSSTVLYWCCGAALVGMAIFACIEMFERNKVNTGGVKIKGNEFEYRQLDALYFAFRQDGDSVDNVVTKYSKEQRERDLEDRRGMDFTALWWFPLVGMFFVLWFFVTPQLGKSHVWLPGGIPENVVPGSWALGRWEAKYSSGSTTIVCNIDSIGEHKTIHGTMELARQAPVKAYGTVRSEKDTIPESFNFKVENTGMSRKQISVSYDSKKKEFSGYYYDRNGVMHELTFTRTPYPPTAEKDVKKSETPAKKANRKTESKSKTTETEAQKQAVEQEEAGAESAETPSEPEDKPSETFWKDTM